MAISPSVRRFDLDPQAVLFCEKAQQLFQLNPTAAEIWSQLAEGQSCQSVIDHFESMGVSNAEAFGFVVGMAEKWLAAGHIIPAEIVSAIEGRPRGRLCLSIGPASAQIQFFGDADLAAFEKVFGHLRSDGASPCARLDVVERSGAYFLISEGRPSGAASAAQVIPFVKAFLTEACCDAVEQGFLGHGALVCRNNKRVLITGSPGAGKTTLTMALMRSGFSFCSDDIVHIDPTGQAAGLPFAAAVKSGAWDLLAGLYPDLLAMDVHERGDGQRVRYVVPDKRGPLEARPIDVVLVLLRDATSPARAERLQPLDALCEILKSGYSPHQRIDAGTIQALAESLCRASSYRLAYGDLAGAVAAVNAIL